MQMLEAALAVVGKRVVTTVEDAQYDFGKENKC
jgi:hypothetical protein